MDGNKDTSHIASAEILSAFGALDCVANVEFDDSRVRGAELCDLKLGSLGHLDEDYVPKMIDSIVEYALQNKKLSIFIYTVGDTKDPKRASYIVNSLNRCKNVSYSMLGVLNPVPEKLIETWDIAIASSGTACALAEYGILTIKYSADGQPMGPLGVLAIRTACSLRKTTVGIHSSFYLIAFVREA